MTRNEQEQEQEQIKTKTRTAIPLYLSQIMDISFSVLTPSLLAFRGINQHKSEITQPNT